MNRETLQRMIDDDEYGLLDSPADDEDADGGWTYGELREIGRFIAAQIGS